MIMPIDNQQLFDAPLMQEATCILLTDARLHGRKIILRHQFPHGLLRVFGETHVAMSEDTDQLPVILHNRNRSEEHTSELQSLMRISYAVFCLKKKNTTNHKHNHDT